MAKRLIGIDSDPSWLRLAVVQSDKGRIRLLHLQRLAQTEPEAPAAAIEGVLGERPGHGDRLTAALPAGAAWVRELEFPFSDRKKLAGALPLELAAQLPIALDDCVVAFQDPLGSGAGTKVLAAAARGETIRQLLEPYDREELPLQVLDLGPFAVATGLSTYFSNGILIQAGETATTLLRLHNGRTSGYRLAPDGPDQAQATAWARHILQAATSLQGAAPAADCPLWLIGSAATEERLQALKSERPDAAIPTLSLDGQSVTAEFLPALGLALRGRDECQDGFNFRQGEFALRSQWAALKPRLVVAALLLLTTALVSAGAAYLNYHDKSRQAEALKKELVRLYRETIPGATTVVDPLLQLQGKIKELEKTNRLGGGAAGQSPLALLQEVSRLTPPELVVDLREWTYTPDGLRLEGVTSSFDAVTRLARSLEQSPLFKEAQVADAKAASDGVHIDFRLNLTFRSPKEQR